MDREINIIPFSIFWIVVIFIILCAKFNTVNINLNKIENNTKEIIDILKNGDV